MSILYVMIVTVMGYPMIKTMYVPGTLIKRLMLLLSSATTPLPQALSPLPCHVPCPLKLCASSLSVDWIYSVYSFAIIIS